MRRNRWDQTQAGSKSARAETGLVIYPKSMMEELGGTKAIDRVRVRDLQKTYEELRDRGCYF
jgi:hypothetical protein